MKSAFMRIPFAQYFLWQIGLRHVEALIWECNLAKEIPRIETKISVEIRKATIRDLRDYAHFGRPPLRRDKALKRLNNGDLCFIALWEGIIIGYMWTTLKRKVYIPEFEREIAFKDEEGYLYDGFVFPDFRRKGLFKKMVEESLHYLKSQNVKRVKGITVTTNRASERVMRDTGFYAVRLVRFVRIFGFQRFEEHKLEALPQVA